ncbi:MAG: hypothetical protein WC438_05880 [Candidatus Pacearchaeota archaeon]
MKTLKLELNIDDTIYDELTKDEKILKGCFAETILKSFYSVMIKETPFYKFSEEAGGVCIISDEYYTEAMKREFHLDEKIIKERDILLDKINKIKKIING